MIPRDILKKIRQIELRTNRLVTQTLAGQYHSVFKGLGMNFEEVREYQPGDDVRSIDWNVSARMNHAYVKKFAEERELTLMLMMDASGSGLFGSRDQSKRELAAEVASLLAFSAIRNNDKVGLILFTDEVDAFIPPRKGRRHVLRVIREVLFFEPRRHGTNINRALEFLLRVTPRQAIAVLLSDFQGHSGAATSAANTQHDLSPVLAGLPVTPSMLRRANRKHDLVAAQIIDPCEIDLPHIGRLVLQDAETGEVVEINTSRAENREHFARRQVAQQTEITRLFRSLGIDLIRLRTGQPYNAEIGRFFENREKRRRHA